MKNIKFHLIKTVVTAMAFILVSGFAHAHPGRTDEAGGHVDKKTGEYHFHKKKEGSEKVDASYDRKDWSHWVDVDDDCQDTRTEVLIRDNSGALKFERDKQCNVTWGKWVCPYTGKVFKKASDIDIDHIVPLSNAHKTGGAGWSPEKKREFANDLLNLIAVEDNINQSKKDRAPDKWVPPRENFWPEYARRWIAVKKKYVLKISDAEMKVLVEMLAK